MEGQHAKSSRELPETSLIKDNAELEKLPLADLEAEMERLQQLVSVDLATQKQFAAMSARIASESTALVALKEKLTDAQGANERATALQQERGGTYRRVIQAIVAEQDVLTELYEPLMNLARRLVWHLEETDLYCVAHR